MSLVTYTERKNTNSIKWDYLTDDFGEEGLHALWVADMDFKTANCISDALVKYASENAFGYYAVPDSYYQSFINWEKTQHNYIIEKDWMRFSPGVVAAFNWIVEMMTEPNDSVIILTPVYAPFSRAVNNNHRTLVTSDLINTNGNYTIDFKDFERKIIENNVKLFISCSPHNPIGRVWTKEELNTLADICKRHDVFIISDEIHHDLIFSEHVHTPFAAIADYDEHMITLTAPSKTFNLAGCQNSIVIIPDANLREKWDAFTNKIHVTSGNTFGYIAAEAAYTHGLSWLEEVKEIIYGNYLYMKETFAKELPEVTVSPLEGTYLAWVDFAPLLSSENMADFMQKKCKLALDYGDWFGGERFGSFVRVNLATCRENIEIAVNAIITNLK